MKDARSGLAKCRLSTMQAILQALGQARRGIDTQGCGVGVLTITHFLREIAISWRSITSLHAFVLLKHLHAHSKLVGLSPALVRSLHDPRRFACLFFFCLFSRSLRSGCLGIRRALTRNSTPIMMLDPIGRRVRRYALICSFILWAVLVLVLVVR